MSGLSPRLGDSEPVPREDDVERCNFGAGEIADLKLALTKQKHVNSSLFDFVVSTHYDNDLHSFAVAYEEWRAKIIEERINDAESV